ncbi:hypothetical protein K8R04_04385 [Candidatus Uhrbacteria bacterium]|nr:hypothetical protein [Candidatus Uhrbacteria bacterium]
MSTRNRTLDVLELLTGHYEVTARDTERAYISISFWLSKTMGNSQIPMEGLLITAKFGDKTRTLVPERLDVSRDRLGMRLAIDALPKKWLGECEITFGRSFRCFPFKGIPDISASLKPERTSHQSVEPSLEAASP